MKSGNNHVLVVSYQLSRGVVDHQMQVPIKSSSIYSTSFSGARCRPVQLRETEARHIQA